MGLSVITAQLLPLPDAAKSVKLYPISQDAHKGIGVARVVDEAEIIWIGRRIECQVIVEFHQVNDRFIANQFTCLAHRDDHAAQVANLLPGWDGSLRISTFSRDAAFSDTNWMNDLVFRSRNQLLFFLSWNIRERLKPMRISPLLQLPVVSVMKARSFMPAELEICN